MGWRFLSSPISASLEKGSSVACTSRVVTVVGHKKDSFDHYDRVVKILGLTGTFSHMGVR